MTEQEWLQAADPVLLLNLLRGSWGKRKLRLFACSCCRRVEHLMTDSRSLRAVEMAERFADGVIDKERYPVRRSARLVGRDAVRNATRAAGRAAAESLETKIEAFFQHIGQNAAAASAWSAAREIDPNYTDPAKADAAWDAAFTTERSIQCHLLRCIFGNPFRSVALNPAWQTWHDGLLVSMAQQMYEGREFSAMPILADALEEAGCTDPDILGHCRLDDEHVRGCWVIDALLGKS